MRNFFLFFKIVGLILVAACSNKNHNYQKQMEACRMAELGIHYYWNRENLPEAEKEFFKGITIKGNLDAVAYFFEKAIELHSSFLPYKFSLASTFILQGKVTEAIALYDKIILQDPTNFEARLLKTTYSHYLNPTNLLQEISSLSSINTEKTKTYQKKIEQAILLINQPVLLKAYRYFKDVSDKEHAIVVLGYSLAENGSLKDTLIRRLEQALALHAFYPTSPIIVTGGVPKSGITESYKMKEWLKEKGVNESLIWMEDQAKDTVGNAIFSTTILSKIPNLSAVTLVSSATHARRGLVTLGEASTQKNLNLKLISLAELDFPSIEEMKTPSPNEYLVIFRDLLRTSGIFAYPGLQR